MISLTEISNRVKFTDPTRGDRRPERLDWVRFYQMLYETGDAGSGDVFCWFFLTLRQIGLDGMKRHGVRPVE